MHYLAPLLYNLGTQYFEITYPIKALPISSDLD